jgi:hypothetical protein
MALAHQISLVDLSGPEFARMRASIDQAATNIVSQRNAPDALEGTEEGDPDEPEIDGTRTMVRNIRAVLRDSLNTQPPSVPLDAPHREILEPLLQPAVDGAVAVGELFVAMANGPFMLLMVAENKSAFLEYVQARSSHNVSITWTMGRNEGKTWSIQPAGQRTGQDYKLSFNLPKRLADWIFAEPSSIRGRALGAKNEFFSNIFIYRRPEGADQLIRLRYDPEATLQYVRQLNDRP